MQSSQVGCDLEVKRGSTPFRPEQKDGVGLGYRVAQVPMFLKKIIKRWVGTVATSPAHRPCGNLSQEPEQLKEVDFS